MSGFLSLGNDQYIGTLVLSATAGVQVGQFVVPDYANGVATVPADATAGDGDVLFVQNEIDTVFEQMIDDADFVLKNGKFVKGHVPQTGDIIVTTNFTGTPAKGDILAVGADGDLVAIAARTPKYSFTVKSATEVFYGNPAISVVVK